MRRHMQTTIALPSIASRRFPKCSTMSRATTAMRFSAPTIPSPSVACSKPGSRIGFSCSSIASLARRLSQ